MVAFLGMMMFAGMFWGFIEAFLFWHLDDLGAPRFLMGWTVAVGMVTSLPFLIFSGPITDTIGHMNVIILGMLAYTGRMLGYSFIANPIFVYPFEALEGLTMALMMTSAVTYVAKISNPATIASVMGMMGALFFGVGKGSGSLFGGLIMSYIGAPNTFRFLAVNAAICALTYGFFQCLYVRPRKNRESKAANANADASRKEKASSLDLRPSPPPVVATAATLVTATMTSSPPPSVPKIIDKECRLPTTTDLFTVPKPVSVSETDTSTGPRSITGGTRV